MIQMMKTNGTYLAFLFSDIWKAEGMCSQTEKKKLQKSPVLDPPFQEATHTHTFSTEIIGAPLSGSTHTWIVT